MWTWNPKLFILSTPGVNEECTTNSFILISVYICFNQARPMLRATDRVPLSRESHDKLIFYIYFLFNIKAYKITLSWMKSVLHYGNKGWVGLIPTTSLLFLYKKKKLSFLFYMNHFSNMFIIICLFWVFERQHYGPDFFTCPGPQI